MDENNVSISVSGDTKYAEQLAADMEAKAESVLESFDIKGKVEKAEALGTEALRELARSTSLYTEEEIAAMSDEQLYAVIAEGRIETALLITEPRLEGSLTESRAMTLSSGSKINSSLYIISILKKKSRAFITVITP